MKDLLFAFALALTLPSLANAECCQNICMGDKVKILVNFSARQPLEFIDTLGVLGQVTSFVHDNRGNVRARVTYLGSDGKGYIKIFNLCDLTTHLDLEQIRFDLEQPIKILSDVALENPLENINTAGVIGNISSITRNNRGRILVSVKYIGDDDRLYKRTYLQGDLEKYTSTCCTQ